MSPHNGIMATKTAATFPTLELNDGRKIPVLGLGCMEFVNDQALMRDAAYEAIKLGYRHFDIAWVYGTEQLVGQGIRKAIDDGLVTREEVFVTTKVWLTNLKPEDLIAQAKESNENIGLGYIDLLLIHGAAALNNPADPSVRFPKRADGSLDVNLDVDLVKESWPAMEQVVEMGIAKSIGVSNWYVPILERVCASAKIKPAVNQIESNPLLHQKEILAYCTKHGIIVTAYSPFGGTPPDPQPPVGMPVDPKQNKETNRPILWTDPTIAGIASKHGKSVPQILIKFHVARGVTVIPKTIKADRLKENADVFDFELDAEDIAKLDSLDSGRACGSDFWHRLNSSEGRDA